jgi:hypothetical protein
MEDDEWPDHLVTVKMYENVEIWGLLYKMMAWALEL